MRDNCVVVLGEIIIRMEVLTNDSIRFFSNGILHRILYNSENGHALMITTREDYAIVEILDWNNPAQRSEMTRMSFPDPKTAINQHGWTTYGGGWRELSPHGPDKTAIREIISAINYAVSEEARAQGDSYTGEITAELCGLIADITDKSRPVWGNNPHEPIPTPIPSRSQEINN